MIAIPTHEARRTAYRVPTKPLKGIDAAVHGLIGRYRRRSGVFDELKRDAERIEQHGAAFADLTDGQLGQRLLDFRETFRRGGRARSAALLPAFAAVREAAARTLGMRPFFVQMIGALALHRGTLAEMATGEGKTLTAGVAAVLAGWTRRPCHIVTVNDYLVERDAERLGPLYRSPACAPAA